MHSLRLHAAQPPDNTAFAHEHLSVDSRSDSSPDDAPDESHVTRVLVAASNAVVRAGLEALVREQPSFKLAGSVVGSATLARQLDDLQPDVLLLEADVHDDEAVLAQLGLDAVQHIPAIILLTDIPQSSHAANEVLRAGVRGLLPRETTTGEIAAAIEAVANGLVVLHTEMLDSLLADETPAERVLSNEGGQTLSPREIEVLGMIAEGLGNKTIAWRLGISEHTVKFHVGSIFTKLNAASRTEAVTLGIRRGLIMI